MFRHLFDLSYERNLDETIVFYFFYIILGAYIAGIFRFYIDAFSSKLCVILTFCVPFVFYTLVAVSIVLKKNLKDRHSISLVGCTIALTLFMPLVLALFSYVWSNFLHASFIQECGMAFRVCFFSGLILGFIPVAILSTKEDCSLNKFIQEMEQEKLEQERKIEKQLLTERAIARKIEELKNNTTDNKDND